MTSCFWRRTRRKGGSGIHVAGSAKNAGDLAKSIETGGSFVTQEFFKIKGNDGYFEIKIWQGFRIEIQNAIF